MRGITHPGQSYQIEHIAVNILKVTADKIDVTGGAYDASGDSDAYGHDSVERG